MTKSEMARNIPTGVGRRGLQSLPPERATGTSPRAWGEGRASPGRRDNARNIPTGVGRRLSPVSRPSRSPEHPHGRGEKALINEPLRGLCGTSPRAWGEVRDDDIRNALARNIPTGVGRRARSWPARRPRTEHPHGRGEKLHPCGEFSAARGTSPRAWGEGRADQDGAGDGRNIPTGVGRRRQRQRQ